LCAAREQALALMRPDPLRAASSLKMQYPQPRL
jgi:hypothetical protein